MVNLPDFVIICLVCTPASIAKLDDYLYIEWHDDGIITYAPGVVCSITAAILHIVPVGNINALYLLNIYANLYSNLVAATSSSENKSLSFLN